MKTKVVHPTQSIKDALNNWDQRTWEKVATSNGVTPYEMKERFRKMSSDGKKFVPLGHRCSRFTYEEGCTGHITNKTKALRLTPVHSGFQIGDVVEVINKPNRAVGLIVSFLQNNRVAVHFRTEETNGGFKEAIDVQNLILAASGLQILTNVERIRRGIE